MTLLSRVAGLLCVMLLGLAATAPARAQSLVDAKTSALPAVPSQAQVLGMAAVDGTLAVLARDGIWRLSTDKRRWERKDWPTAQTPVGTLSAVADGVRSYVLEATPAGGWVGVHRLGADARGFAWEAMPALPSALTQANAAVSGGRLVVLGIGASGALQAWQLDPATSAWAPFAAPRAHGVPRTFVAQGKELFASFGDGVSADHMQRWSSEHGWRDAGPAPAVLSPGSGRALGQAHVLYLAGTDAAAVPMTFQTITSAWARIPGTDIVHPSAAVPWDAGMAWVAQTPGQSPRVNAFAIDSPKFLLTWLDWAVIVVYLAAMIGIGLYFYLREKRSSTDSFFVGNRTIPFWAAGLSLYAVNTSSISFIAIPAKAFETNWQYLTNNLIAVLGLMFVAIWIVPLLRRLDLMSVFSYLETRFHPAIRMLASALAILTQIGSRMSVILFLPALAIATITGISVVWSVVLMGGFTIVYTAMGGMKAVIWTDVVQVIVKMGGAIFAIGFIVWSLHGGVGEFLSTARAEDKMHLLDFRFDLTQATVWGFIFLVLFDVVLTFPKDQVLMQRTLSTKSDKEAGRSIWAFAAIMIPGGFVFYMIGTALFVYYKNHPERMNPTLPIDATFPLFIAAELPMGVTGLIIAGIFAAAMATLSGIMNSVATLVSVDFYDRLAKDKSPKKSVFFAEAMTVVVGLVGIASALVLSRFDVRSLFDVSIELAGLLGGGFAGAYTLGMFTRRANSPGVAIGIASSIALTFLAWSMDLVHPYFYLAISILLCIVIGYVASLFFPPPQRSLKGLTIYRDVD